MTILTQQNYLAKDYLGPDSRAILPAKPTTPLIEVAALELTSIPLHRNLINFARKADLRQIKQIKVVPLFLVSGVHVTEDIPQEIDLALKKIKTQVQIKLLPYLGKYSGIAPLLSRSFTQIPGERLLIAHGSRLSAGIDYYRQLARQLDAEVAFWATSPRFDRAITDSIAAGAEKIAILPYFLFPGRITAAISAEIAELRLKYPQVELSLGQPLGRNEAIAELIMGEV